MAKTPKTSTNVPADMVEDTTEELLPGEIAEGASEETAEVTTDTAEVEQPPVNDAPDTNAAAPNESGNDVLNRIEGEAVALLDWEEMPKEARTPKRHVRNAIESIEEYNDLRKVFVANTSGREAKIAAHIEAMTEESDPTGFGMLTGIEDIKRQLAELEESLKKSEETFNAYVDSELAKSGAGVWDTATTEAKKAEIREYYAMAKTARDTAMAAIETHNKHRAPDSEALGHIDQYVPKIERPSGGTAGAGNAGRASDGKAGTNASGERAPQVTDARYSLDGGKTWVRAERKINESLTVSNPAEIASHLGKAFGKKVDKQDVIEAWLNENGTSFDNMDKSKVKDVTEFTFTDGDNSAMVRLTRKIAA